MAPDRKNDQGPDALLAYRRPGYHNIMHLFANAFGYDAKISTKL